MRPTPENTAAHPRSGLSVPRGLIAGTLVAVALVWGPYAVIPRSSLLSALVQSGVYLALLVTRAGYVRNIQHDPRVRVRLRIGLRYRWVPGIATVRPDDDALARQRQIIAWHPLRALNAVNVRVLGADLLTVHVQLNLAQADQANTRAS
jgi:hypothetical protein